MGEGLIDADPTVSAQIVFRYLPHQQGRGTAHLNIRRPAQQVLAGSGTTHLLIVRSGAVPAVDGHRPAGGSADPLQQLHQIRVDLHQVCPVPAGELPHPEVGGQQLVPLPGKAVCPHAHSLARFSACVPK